MIFMTFGNFVESSFMDVRLYSDFQSPSSNIGFPLMSLYCKRMANPVTLQMQIQMQY